MSAEARHLLEEVIEREPSAPASVDGWPRPLTHTEERAFSQLLRDAALFLLTPSRNVQAVCRERMAEHCHALRMASQPDVMGLRGSAEIAIGRIPADELQSTKEWRLQLVLSEILAKRMGT